MKKCTTCKLGVFLLDSDENLYCNHCGYIIPKHITTKKVRAQARNRTISLQKGVRCKFCKEVKPLTKHHIIPQRTGLETKTVLLCRGCHNIADMVANVLYPDEIQVDLRNRW